MLKQLKGKFSQWVLGRAPRYTITRATLLHKKIRIADGPSFRFMYKEIFKKEVFRFKASGDSPFIIDAGANIGMATIYFKQLYPKAKIIAFEPDPHIFRLLEENVSLFNNQNVTLINKALSNQASYLNFHSEGADAGRIVSSNGYTGIIKVPAVRLGDYINGPVDFLKMDIEGAEVDVLPDIEDKLPLINKLFIEYHSFVNEPQRLNELISLLSRHHRVYIDSPGLSSENPFIHVRTYLDMDMQLNIYAIRT